jgi:hypothetical protein
VTEPATHQVPPDAGSTGYRERLRTPWWWYPAGALVGVLLGAEFAFIIPAWLTWLPIVLSALLAMLVVWRLSSATVQVTGGELIAGDRNLALARIERAIDLSATELRRAVGRHGDPLAFNFIRSWVGPGVQLILNHPPENELVNRLPEPYWLISTRHPHRLIAALAARSADQ